MSSSGQDNGNGWTADAAEYSSLGRSIFKRDLYRLDPAIQRREMIRALVASALFIVAMSALIVAAMMPYQPSDSVADAARAPEISADAGPTTVAREPPR